MNKRKKERESDERPTARKGRLELSDHGLYQRCLCPEWYLNAACLPCTAIALLCFGIAILELSTAFSAASPVFPLPSPPPPPPLPPPPVVLDLLFLVFFGALSSEDILLSSDGSFASLGTACPEKGRLFQFIDDGFFRWVDQCMNEFINQMNWDLWTYRPINLTNVRAPDCIIDWLIHWLIFWFVESVLDILSD